MNRREIEQRIKAGCHLRVLAKYYYNADTFGAPKDGYLVDERTDKPQEFASIEDIVAEFAKGFGGAPSGVYVLDPLSGIVEAVRCGEYSTRHGEYSSPTYLVRCFHKPSRSLQMVGQRTTIN